MANKTVKTVKVIEKPKLCYVIIPFLGEEEAQRFITRVQALGHVSAHVIRDDQITFKESKK